MEVQEAWHNKANLLDAFIVTCGLLLQVCPSTERLSVCADGSRHLLEKRQVNDTRKRKSLEPKQKRSNEGREKRKAICLSSTNCDHRAGTIILNIEKHTQVRLRVHVRPSWAWCCGVRCLNAVGDRTISPLYLVPVIWKREQYTKCNTQIKFQYEVRATAGR